MLVDKFHFNPGQSVAHYKILSLLGEGGMGQVYLAEDTKLHRKVSLKFLSSGFTEDRERLRRFQQEARAVSALNHPNILTIHEISDSADARFIATEFIEGQTLRQRLGSRLDVDDALEIAIQVASALVAAHRVNIVHRDIKPENIMIRNEDGLVKVLDFGLAKTSARTQSDGSADSQIATALMANTSPGVVMGTVAYMSPEQARGDTIDERSDIWSLGVVLYEMVAGCSPFMAGTSNEIVSAILAKTRVPPLARYAHDVPPRLEEIIEKSLTKDREERYQTSKDLLIDLRRLKQSLADSERLETGDGPASKVVGQSQPPAEDTATISAAQTTNQTTSSAEYLFTQVKNHKLGVVDFRYRRPASRGSEKQMKYAFRSQQAGGTVERLVFDLGSSSWPTTSICRLVTKGQLRSPLVATLIAKSNAVLGAQATAPAVVTTTHSSFLASDSRPQARTPALPASRSAFQRGVLLKGNSASL